MKIPYKLFEALRYVTYLLPYSPFRGMIWSHLNKNLYTILDVGCGNGEVTQAINFRFNKLHYKIGLDIFIPSLLICKKKNIYDDCVIADARLLPFKDKSVDGIVCAEVIEHLTKSEGRNFIHNLDDIACKQIIITTPNSPFRMKMQEFDLEEFKGNIFQMHKSLWTSNEFKNLGYLVRGQLPHFPHIKRFNISSYLRKLSWIFPFTLITYYFPELSESLLCIKHIKNYF